jgi:hypothetical protein
VGDSNRDANRSEQWQDRVRLATFSRLPPGRWTTAAVLFTVYVSFWMQYASVRVDNFGGIDEWMILSLVSRGVIAVPHANRPFGLLFNLPAALFPAHLLEASWLLHGHYLVLAGLLMSLLLLRMAPDRPDWALLCGVFASTIAPSDTLRLVSIYSSAYSGVSAATVLVVLLLMAGARSDVCVVIAAGLCLVVARVYEGPLALLLLAPLLLRLLGTRISRAPLTLYYCAAGLAVVLVGLPFLLDRPEAMYQRQILGVYLEPGGLLLRLVSQYRLHLAPLFWRAPMESVGWRGAAADALLAVMLVLLRPAFPRTRKAALFARAAAVGMLAAAAAYSGFLLAARLTGARRTEILSAPWIGLALAAAILFLSEWVPSRASSALVVVLAVYLNTASFARTTELQQARDLGGAFHRQAQAMAQIVSIAPGLKAGTLAIMLDGSQTWLGSFVFHHAMDLLYDSSASGCVANGREEVFYTCWMDKAGVHHDPWPILRSEWRARNRTFGYDEVVVLASDEAGHVSLLPQWPSSLPPMPQGAIYDPEKRVSSLAPPCAARAILDRAR